MGDRQYNLGLTNAEWYNLPQTQNLINELRERVSTVHPQNAITCGDIHQLNRVRGSYEEDNYLLGRFEALRG